MHFPRYLRGKSVLKRGFPSDLLTFETKPHQNSVVYQKTSARPKFHLAVSSEVERTDDFL